VADADPIFSLRSLRKAFNGLTVLDGVSLDVQRGSTTVIIGPSGCGKSVLLKSMILLLRPDEGAVWFDGREITSLSERRLASVRRRVGFLFQGGALFDSMTLAQNLAFPLVETRAGSVRQRRQRVEQVLSLVGLDGLGDRLPAELSGGQQKRGALARAVVLGPEVVFYDEPTTGLDPIRSDLINELILKLNAELGVTSVVVTHDMASARKVGDRIVMLHEGRFIADLPPQRLDHSEDDVVLRFVAGRASPEELAKIESGRFVPVGLAEDPH
jgi:phospholipid/cholesterol/gamma-HCH transport system ATP-binding protein